MRYVYIFLSTHLGLAILHSISNTYVRTLFFCTFKYTLREFELSLRLGLKFGKTKMGVCPLHVGPFTLDWLGSTT